MYIAGNNNIMAQFFATLHIHINRQQLNYKTNHSQIPFITSTLTNYKSIRKQKEVFQRKRTVTEDSFSYFAIRRQSPFAVIAVIHTHNSIFPQQFVKM